MKIEITNDGYVDALTMRHELNGLSAGLFTALDVVSHESPDMPSLQHLLRLCAERLTQISAKLGSVEQNK